MWCCPLHCAVLPLMLRGCVKPASVQNFQVCLGPVWFGAAWSGSVWFGAGLAAPGMWRLIRHSARLCTLMSGGWAGGMHGRRQVGTAAPLLSPPPTLAPLPMPGVVAVWAGGCTLLAACLRPACSHLLHFPLRNRGRGLCALATLLNAPSFSISVLAAGARERSGGARGAAVWQGGAGRVHTGLQPHGCVVWWLFLAPALWLGAWYMTVEQDAFILDFNPKAASTPQRCGGWYRLD